MAGVLFEDIFDVKDIDPEGKKFDRGEFVTSHQIVVSSKAAQLDAGAFRCHAVLRELRPCGTHAGK